MPDPDSAPEGAPESAAENPQRFRRPDQLPPGRHGIPREAVVQNQRDRILRAVVDVASVAGYGVMVVEDIISTAGVSRRTFYDYFPNKEAAFLDAYDQAVDQLKATVGAAYMIEGNAFERTTSAVSALVNTLADDPAMAEMGVVEVLAAGAEAIERRSRAMERLSTLITDGVLAAGGADASTPLTVETVVGGIHEVIYTRVLRGQLEELRKMVPDIVYALFLPYTGTEGAEASRTAAVKFLKEGATSPQQSNGTASAKAEQSEAADTKSAAGKPAAKKPAAAEDSPAKDSTATK